LGRHRKLKPSQISRRLTTAAVPALAGVAATLCLAPQAQASPLAPRVSLDHATAADTLGRVGAQSPAELLAASRRAVASKPAKYTVRPGDSLSTIAGIDNMTSTSSLGQTQIVVQFALDLADTVKRILQRGSLLHQLLRLLRIVPEIGIFGELVQFREPRRGCIDVKDASSAARPTA